MTKALIRPRRWAQLARRRRQELFELLGWECVLCGEDDEDELEFDHIYGRNYVARELSSHMRHKRYLEEAKAGKLRVLCGECNLAERKRLDNGRVVATNAVIERTEDMPF